MTTTTARSPNLARGDRLGDYEILGLLGEGGMAAVYLARRAGIEGFAKLVAIKRIHPHYAGEQDFVDMFLDEASLAANLSHPNVAQVYDIGRADGSYYFAMEYLHGRDVLTVLKTAAKNGRGLSMSNALTIVSQAAAGLHHAHRQSGPDGKPLGIVHRDVSPANIVVTYEGAVKIVDFGIAKAMSRRTRTRTGRVKGKTAYLSPEQCRGEELDARSDVFALGVVLFELTTGTRLFGNLDEIAIIHRLLYEPFPLPSSRRSDYPEALEAIVVQAMAREPFERFESARAVQRAIESYANEEQIPLSSIGLAEYMRELFGDSPPLEAVVEAAATRVTAEAQPAAKGGGTLPSQGVSPGDVSPAEDAPVQVEDAREEPVRGKPPRWLLATGAAALLVAGGTLAAVTSSPRHESEASATSSDASLVPDPPLASAVAEPAPTAEPVVSSTPADAPSTTASVPSPAPRAPAPSMPSVTAKPAPQPVDDDKLLLE